MHYYDLFFFLVDYENNGEALIPWLADGVLVVRSWETG